MTIDTDAITALILAANSAGYVSGLRLAARLPLDCDSEMESEKGTAAHLRTRIENEIKAFTNQEKKLREMNQ